MSHHLENIVPCFANSGNSIVVSCTGNSDLYVETIQGSEYVMPITSVRIPESHGSQQFMDIYPLFKALLDQQKPLSSEQNIRNIIPTETFILEDQAEDVSLSLCFTKIGLLGICSGPMRFSQDTYTAWVRPSSLGFDKPSIKRFKDNVRRLCI